jgi:hypothetical protein
MGENSDAACHPTGGRPSKWIIIMPRIYEKAMKRLSVTVGEVDPNEWIQFQEAAEMYGHEAIEIRKGGIPIPSP